MVRFLLEQGADLEHKTDEMHTALMEASMDGHVDVARYLLDRGAQVRVLLMILPTGMWRPGKMSFVCVILVTFIIGLDRYHGGAQCNVNVM